jgi:hypothetical protein
MDGYTTNEVADGSYSTSTGIFTSGAKPPAIRDGYTMHESIDETVNVTTGAFTSGYKPPIIRA